MPKITITQFKEKLNEYKKTEFLARQKIFSLQNELSKTNTQLANIQGAIAALEDLLPENKHKKEVEFKEK